MYTKRSSREASPPPNMVSINGNTNTSIMNNSFTKEFLKHNRRMSTIGVKEIGPANNYRNSLSGQMDMLSTVISKNLAVPKRHLIGTAANLPFAGKKIFCSLDW